MKRTLVIVVTVVILLGMAAGIFWLRSKPRTIEDVLPGNALFYFKVTDAADNVAAITASGFWQSLNAVRWDYLLEQGRLTPEQKELLRSLPEKLADPATALLLKEFFGREFALVFYPPPTDPQEIAVLPEQDMYPFVRKMFSRVLLVTRVEGKGLFIDFLSGLFLEKADVQFRLEAVDRHGYKLYYATLPGTDWRLGFVRLGDFLVIGIDDEIIEKGIRTFRRKAASLAGNEHFRKSRQRALSPAEFNGYWNMAQIAAYTNEYVGALIRRMEEEIRRSSQEPGTQEALRQNVEAVRAWMKERSRLAAGMDVLGISGRWEDMLTLKFDLYFNKEQLDPRRAPLYDCPGTTNASLAFVPADVVGYQWSNCVDLNVSWEEIRQEAAGMRRQSADTLSPVDAIENVLAVDIQEDVLPAFDDEMGGYVKNIRQANAFPVPDILFFMEIKDALKIRQLFEKLHNRFLDRVHNEEYNGIPLEYVIGPLAAGLPAGGEAMELAYCILDKYALFALNRSLLKEAIDSYQKRLPSLAANTDLLEGDFSVDEGTRSLQFLRVDAAVRSLETVLAWNRTRLTARDAQREAFRSGSAQRLADVVKETETKENELVEVQNRVTALEETTTQQTELNQFKERVQILGGEIEALHKQQAELGETLEGYEYYVTERKRREEIEQKIADPFVKSLGFLKTWRLRTTAQPGVIETSVFLKVE